MNSQINKKLVIKDTLKYGKGIFAKEDIKKKEIIYILKGKKLELKDIVERINSGEEYIDDPFQIGRKTYLDLDEISRTFNHSCDPNGGIRKTSELFAIKDIKKGDEITYDYSLTISPTVWEMKCKCGSKNCRKILHDILSIPKERRFEYKKAGALQRYMKPLLKEVDAGIYKMPRYEVLALEKLNNNKKK